MFHGRHIIISIILAAWSEDRNTVVQTARNMNQDFQSQLKADLLQDVLQFFCKTSILALLTIRGTLNALVFH